METKSFQTNTAAHKAILAIEIVACATSLGCAHHPAAYGTFILVTVIQKLFTNGFPRKPWPGTPIFFWCSSRILRELQQGAHPREGMRPAAIFSELWLCAHPHVTAHLSSAHILSRVCRLPRLAKNPGSAHKRKIIDVQDHIFIV